MATDTRRLRVIVTGDSGDAQQAIEGVGAVADKTGGKIGKLAGMLASWASRGAIALGVMGAAGAAMGIKTAMQLEQVEVGFTTMLGSADKAKKMMVDLQKFAAATPFEFTELVGSAQRFLAMGFAAKDIIPMLRSVGDAVAAMGGSSESVDLVTRALGQMSAKGRVSGEELMQLTEQGIPALQILADTFGVSAAEMSKMISQGKVMSDKAIPALIKGLREGTAHVKGFGGMMDKQSTTMAGKWSTFMDNLTTGLGVFVRNFEPQIKKAMDVAGKAVGDFFAGLEGKGKAKGFTGTVNEIGLGLRGMVSAFKEGDVTSDGLVGKFETLGARGRDLVEIIKDVVDATKDVVHWMQENEGAVKALTTAIVILMGVTKLHATVMSVQAAGGLMQMFKNTVLVTKATKTAAAVQWVWNGATAAAAYLQIAGYLGMVAIGQKAVAAGTKIAAAAQWALNAAQAANPIGIIIIAIIALVAIIVLLWKKNDNFREGTIKAWNQLKAVVGAVADFFTKTVFPAIMVAVDWLKNAWNASWGAIKSVALGVANFFMAYVWPLFKHVLDGIGFWLKFLYNAVWKPIWILIQIAVKIVAFWFMNIILPLFKLVFNGIMVAVRVVAAGWQFWWGVMKAAVGVVVGWFTSTILPSLQKAFAQLMGVIGFFKNIWLYNWNIMKSAVQVIATWFNVTIIGSLRKAFDQLKWLLGVLKAVWDMQWTKIKNATKVVTDALVGSFKWAKDKIGEQWGKLKDLAREPISFMVNTVYNKGIRKLWNTVAEKFGIKTRLDEIKFADGGVVPGYGPRKDRIPAVLSPGEGIAVPELIKQIGVNRFLDWNKKAREGKPVAFADGGIVGWGKSLLSKGKDIFQGIAGPVVGKLIDGLRPIVNAIPGKSQFAGLARSGGNKMLDGFKSWVAGKDKEAFDFGPHSGSAGGRNLQGMGYAKQMFLLRNRFPGLELISGYRPGAMTLTGNRSYHALGRAVDVPPRKDVFEWIRAVFGPSIKELIFSPMGNRQVWNGKNHMYKEPVRGQHWDHVHWAMDNGGVLPPNSTTVVKNATSSREYALTEDKLKSVAGGNVVINGDVIIKSDKIDAKSLRDELIKLGSRNGGKAGLPGTK